TKRRGTCRFQAGTRQGHYAHRRLHAFFRSVLPHAGASYWPLVNSCHRSLFEFCGRSHGCRQRPNAASPRGFAIRFHLAEHVHTDIVAHSHDGFPTRTAEEFVELLRAIGNSGPDAPKPTPIESFLG